MSDDDKVVDFQTAKAPFAHAKRERNVTEIRKAFEAYLEGDQSRQQKRKKERDRNKKKK